MGLWSVCLGEQSNSIDGKSEQDGIPRSRWSSSLGSKQSSTDEATSVRDRFVGLIVYSSACGGEEREGAVVGRVKMGNRDEQV